MANALPPIPLKTPLLDQTGKLSGTWTGFFRELYNRVGGVSASSNSQLLALITTLQTQVSALEKETDALSQGRQL